MGRSRRLASSLLFLIAWAACGPLPPPEPNGERSTARPGLISGRIVTTERGEGGGVLVLVGESGERLRDLTRLPDDGVTEHVLDINATWSPDGRFIAFASSRTRGLDGTSIWVVDVTTNAEPRRLTRDAGSIDLEPAWSPDGASLAFVSTRGESFDLWRLPLRHGDDGWPEPAGPAVRLTTAQTDERSPSWAPDGRAIAYMAIEPRTQTSTIWRMAPDRGTPRQLTTGPADMTPSWSPNGKTIAFAVGTTEDADLYLMNADGARRRLVVHEPVGEQTGPRWSRDGRYLFATSTYRSVQSGRPAVLSSIVYVDLRESPVVVRALLDPAPLPRLGVALAPEPLRADALAVNPVYDNHLVLEVLEQLVERARARARDDAK